MLDFASGSDVEDIGATAPPSADAELLDAYSSAVSGVDDLIRLLNAERPALRAT